MVSEHAQQLLEEGGCSITEGLKDAKYLAHRLFGKLKFHIGYRSSIKWLGLLWLCGK
ncbi:hypothetical protein MIDIC_50049 [Alphaproteobacteria bacterium]